MKIRLMSDPHIDQNFTFELPIIEGENEQTLVIPGDLCPIRYTEIWKPLLKEFNNRFKNVIWVAGNHEYYGTTLDPVKCDDEVFNYIDTNNLDNVIVAFENKYEELDGVMFVLSTLWTNYNNRNPVEMMHAKRGVNDFRAIKMERNGSIHQSDPEDFASAFDENLNFLKSYEDFCDDNVPIVFVTHHAPTSQSVHPVYANSLLNPCFYSEIIHMFDKVDYWFHGHMHHSTSYTSSHNDHTQVYINPVGYMKREETGFDEKLVIQVGEE